MHKNSFLSKINTYICKQLKREKEIQGRKDPIIPLLDDLMKKALENDWMDTFNTSIFKIYEKQLALNDNICIGTWLEISFWSNISIL